MKLICYVYIKHIVENKPFLNKEIIETIKIIDVEDSSVNKIDKAGSKVLQK